MIIEEYRTISGLLQRRKPEPQEVLVLGSSSPADAVEIGGVSPQRGVVPVAVQGGAKLGVVYEVLQYASNACVGAGSEMLRDFVVLRSGGE